MNEDDNLIVQKLGVVSYDWRKATNGNDYLSVLLSNREFANCFDKEAIAILTEPSNKGKTFKLVIKGKEFNGRTYYSIVSVDGVVDSSLPVVFEPRTSGKETTREKSIERQVAFKAAIELATVSKIALEQIEAFTDEFARIISGEKK